MPLRPTSLLLLGACLSFAALSTSSARAEDLDCARCREVCRTHAYPEGPEPDMHSGRLVHRSPEAKKDFEDGVAADPGLGGKNARVAVEAYKRAVLADPDNAPYRNHLAAALLSIGQFNEAIYNLERAAAIVPTEPKYTVNLGYAWHRAGDEQRALVHYMRALILDARDVRARLFTGYAVEQLGMRPEAVREFRRVLLDDPANTGARSALVRLGKESPPAGVAPPMFEDPPPSLTPPPPPLTLPPPAPPVKGPPRTPAKKP